MRPNGKNVIRFGPFEVVPLARTITNAGKILPLEPKAFDLLIYLIDNRNRLVEKHEIFEQVWDGAFVTDNALTRTMSRLRKALGDSARSPHVIETIYSKGYRFLPEVESIHLEHRQGPAIDSRSLTLEGSSDRLLRLGWLLTLATALWLTISFWLILRDRERENNAGGSRARNASRLREGC